MSNMTRISKFDQTICEQNCPLIVSRRELRVWKGMGNTLKYEAMDLSPLERKIIMESWLSLRRKLSLCGQTFILIFLHEHPEYLSHFPLKFRGNPDLAEILGLKVMREFSRIVANLEALHEIAGYLREVAENHQPRKLGPKAFDDFRTSFLKMLREQLQNHKHLSLYLQCWDKLLKLINLIVLDIIGEIDRKAPISQVKIPTYDGSKIKGRMQLMPTYEPVGTRTNSMENTRRHRIKFSESIEDF